MRGFFVPAAKERGAGTSRVGGIQGRDNGTAPRREEGAAGRVRSKVAAGPAAAKKCTAGRPRRGIVATKRYLCPRKPICGRTPHSTPPHRTTMTQLRPLFPDLDPRRPLLIAGPCSAETEEQLLTTARALAAQGLRIFRAGLWKPRTKPGGFEGVGAAGLVWMERVRRETGMRVATEVATREHVSAALDAGIDLLWLGARTVSNPFAVQEVADALQGHDIPVLVKNPVSPDIDLWVGGIERLLNAGIGRLGAVHRGFGAADRGGYRNPPQWAIPIELRRRMPSLPLLCDPSHIGGRRELVAPLARQAMELGFDGVMVEVHCDPARAWSDAGQQLTPDELKELAAHLELRRVADSGDGLAEMRLEIDRLDDQLVELLDRRMAVSRRIGRYKREHAMPVLQSRRYEELLARRTAEAAALGMAPEFMRSVLQAIHEESVRQQLSLPEDEAKR